MLKNKNLKFGDVINKQYKILENFDSKPHSSKIYKGVDVIKGDLVVIKITSAMHKEKNKNVTKILQKLRGGVGIPNILWRGMEGTQTITVTECLGPNLKKLFLLMEKKFQLPTVAMIGIQVLNTLENIHKHDYVCCNIMPKEILISLHKKNMTLYITDFKQAKKVKNGKIVNSGDETNHLAHKAILNKFSSVNLHLGLVPSTKDDLESLGYILIYFLKEGILFDRPSKSMNKEEKMKFYEQQKLLLIPDTLGPGVPNEMVSYMNYVKSLQSSQMNDKIDYEFLRKLFKTLFLKHWNNDGSTEFQYDWLAKARLYSFDGQSKCTDRCLANDNSFTGLDIAPSSLMVASPKEYYDKIIPNSLQNYQDGNNNNKEYEKEETKDGLLNNTKSSIAIHIIQNQNSFKSNDNSFTNDRSVLSKKSLFSGLSKQKTDDNEDNIAKGKDIFERLDPNDTVGKKFDDLRIFSKEVKTIEHLKYMSRVGISSSLDSKTIKMSNNAFYLKKTYT